MLLNISVSTVRISKQVSTSKNLREALFHGRIEIGGAQHLDCAEAYRRDRRKDMLLQEAGYFVMRFLYDDVLSDLPYVLEAILWEVRRRADAP